MVVLTADIVVFGVDPVALNVLLIKRGRVGTAFEGHWALPGGKVDEDEDLLEAAFRELREETCVEPSHIEQVGTFGKPGRDPRGRFVSVAYMTLVRTDAVQVRGGDDATEAVWRPINDIGPLAFDHQEIIDTALQKLRLKLQCQPIGLELLPEVFLLRDLQKLYEMILGHNLDRQVFHKKMMSMGVLEPDPSGSSLIGDLRRTPKWRFNSDYKAARNFG